MMKVLSKIGSKTMLLRTALKSSVCMAPDPAPLADKAAAISVGSKVRVQDKHPSR